MNTNTDINELKANGEFFAAGALAARQGRPDYYGCHFGARQSLEFARSEFSEGWHSVQADVAYAAFEASISRGDALAVTDALHDAYRAAHAGAAAATARVAYAVAADAARARAATADNIEQLKAWCLENYEHGADTMVECWDDASYKELLDDCDGNLAEALSVLKGIAGAYADQQADARYHADGSAWAAAAGDAK
jgi:hypothetical protein